MPILRSGVIKQHKANRSILNAVIICVVGQIVDADHEELAERSEAEES